MYNGEKGHVRMHVSSHLFIFTKKVFNYMMKASKNLGDIKRFLLGRGERQQIMLNMLMLQKSQLEGRKIIFGIYSTCYNFLFNQ
jgi:hypothetical protein